VKEAKQISKVDPKSTIQAPGIESSIHQRIVTLDHHKAFALKAIHLSPFDIDWLANPVHD
jgi:hypothetical protein